MHTLHFLLINADSATEAADEALNEIADWGNENNWRRLGGIASEDGLDDVENAEDGRWGLSFLDHKEPSTRTDTAFERTTAYLLGLLEEPITLNDLSTHPSLQDAVTHVVAKLQAIDFDTDAPSVLWDASRNLQRLQQLSCARSALRHGADIPELYSWKFAEHGLTDLTGSSDGRQRYILFLDMHN